MSAVGTPENPLRVAVIGAGPAGFYAVEQFCKQEEFVVEIDLIERLPTPYGLVRGGVAPDHQNYKAVTKVYDRIACSQRFRYFGNVDLGKDITHDDLKQFYHQVVYCVGAIESRDLGIPGEKLNGSRTAPEFVAWYNGHPDYNEHTFDLSGERAVVIGAGNVALDVARILSRTHEELAKTDIANHALEALKHSNIREVVILGRRGPLQSAFSTRELKEIGLLDDAHFYVDPADLELDSFSAEELANTTQRTVLKKMELFEEYAKPKEGEKSRSMTMRFLTSPTELVGDENGHVSAIKVVRNRLTLKDGRIRPVATDETETIDTTLVVRSIGYRSRPIQGLPFDDWKGTIPNVEGRVWNPETQEVLTGEYVSGWIKRGPSGTIGTNRTDSIETVKHMLDDAREGKLLAPEYPTVEQLTSYLKTQQPSLVTYSDWKKIDALETQYGHEQGRPRVKFTVVDEMLEVIHEEEENQEEHILQPTKET
jgi:ferredoxin--NADP+ reductase